MRSDRIVRTLAVCAAGLVALSVAGCTRFEARQELKRGNAEYRRGKFESAIEHYKSVPAGTTDAIRAALYTGYAHWRQYKFGSKHPTDQLHATEAIAAFDAYLKLRPAEEVDSNDFPGQAKIDERIITLLIDAEWFEEAIVRLQKKLSASPDDPAILRGIATTYDKWGQPTEAIRWFQKWAARFPDTESPHVAIAAYCWNMSYRQHSMMDSLQRNRWIDIGLESADTCLRLNNDHFEGLLYRNLLLRERAKMRIDPDMIAAHLTEAGQLLDRAKAIKEAAKAAEEAAKAGHDAAAGGHDAAAGGHNDTGAGDESGSTEDDAAPADGDDPPSDEAPADDQKDEDA